MNKNEETIKAIRKIGLSAEQAAGGLRAVITGIEKLRKNRSPIHNHKRKFAGHGNKKEKR